MGCIIALLAALGCKVAKPIPYNLPEDITEKDKPNFVSQFNSGQILYKLHCADCHNIRTAGKDSIPTFSLPQLLDYEIRFQYPIHQDRMTEAQISASELDEIVIFLRYRKPGM